ncbi:Protein LAZ1-like protein 1 [Raphanus sativus]|uniref:Protein LAZ1 homolog 1 n=1 Tax=Raphanus sativus TaxID=3726 RepID=A0A6J0KWL1_RAPSA|nr:protein LAZ1 homolog 1 [Raphanus sativus]XP_056851199.1 protein LAZ1 homolog 1 [Raphanus sativus]KAJ4874528.1 Protein LAZ1-like protein 1 [Raphanus sativus]
MEWRGILCSLFFILSVGESSSRFRIMWLPNLGGVDFVAGTYFTWPILSASVFVAVAFLLSMYLIFQHLASYNQPEEQKFLIGLILMVPVYALESFLSLVNSEAAFNCEVIRDCYEAFALYCFERYMIACLDGEEGTIEFMEQQTVITQTTPLLEGTCSYKVVEHPFPMNCFLKDWNLGPQFYHAVKIGIVQYMILKMICALLAMLLEAFGVYGEGKFQWNYGYPYLAVVLNFSQTWALYCLVQFYNVIKDKLAPIKPLAKFLTFKSIVFLTWWQGIIVAFLFSMGLFKGSLAKELKTRIQDYIICIEMGVAAVVHLYVFPAAPYKRGERCVRNVAVMSDYASIDTPPDPEEVKDSERTTRIRYGRHDDESEKRLNFPQSVRDVVMGSGEIIADDMRFTVSHVVEPVERGIAKINRTFHQISENVKRFEQQKKKKGKTKDDSYVIPLNPWTREVRENLHEGGSVSDSGLGSTTKRHHHESSISGLWTRMRR